MGWRLITMSTACSPLAPGPWLSECLKSPHTAVPIEGSSMRRQENGTAKHAKHADGICASQAQHDAFDVEARQSEVDQQTQPQARRFEIVQALRPMNLVERPDRLQLHQDRVLDQQVHGIFANHDAVIPNGHSMLLRDGKPSLPQLMRQCVFINLLQEPHPQRALNRQSAADDPPGQPVHLALNLRVLSVCGSIFLSYCRHRLAKSLTLPPRLGPRVPAL